MIRLAVCVLVLGGAVAFLSCNSGSEVPQNGRQTDGKGPVKGGSTGQGGTDGAGPFGGFHGGILGSDGAGPIGGSQGSQGGIGDGNGPIGTGGHGVGGIGGHPVGGYHGGIATDGAGPIGGHGGIGGGDCTGGRECIGGTYPCDGLAYFEKRWCASTYAAQVGKSIVGNCATVTAYVSSCEGQNVWFTEYKSLGDPVVCAYDAAGTLVAARVCTDTTMPDWNCNAAPQSPMCLSAGTVPNIRNCSRLSTCSSPNGFGDGSGPIGGHGGP